MKLTAKKILGTKLTACVKFGDKNDSKKRLGTELTTGVKFGDEIGTFAYLSVFMNEYLFPLLYGELGKC